MNLSERFLNLVQQQLSSFDSDVAHLVVYVANTETGRSPSLELVALWPKTAKKFPPVETDPELRTPSSIRRWYPLQEGSILLGVIRAEHFPVDKIWPEKLDQKTHKILLATLDKLIIDNPNDINILHSYDFSPTKNKLNNLTHAVHPV